MAVLESYLSGASDGAPPVEIVVHVDAGATAGATLVGRGRASEHRVAVRIASDGRDDLPVPPRLLGVELVHGPGVLRRFVQEPVGERDDAVDAGQMV